MDKIIFREVSSIKDNLIKTYVHLTREKDGDCLLVMRRLILSDASDESLTELGFKKLKQYKNKTLYFVAFPIKYSTLNCIASGTRQLLDEPAKPNTDRILINI